MVPTDLKTTLPAVPAVLGRARRMLDEYAVTPIAERLDDARLVISELVGNAIRHRSNGPTVDVRLHWDGRALTMEVTNRGGGFEPSLPPASGWDSQFGLVLVDELVVVAGPDDGVRTNA